MPLPPAAPPATRSAALRFRRALRIMIRFDPPPGSRLPQGANPMPLRYAPYLLAAAVLCATAPVGRAGSSSSLLDLSPDGSRLLVANSDNGTITVVSTAEGKALREIK